MPDDIKERLGPMGAMLMGMLPEDKRTEMMAALSSNSRPSMLSVLYGIRNQIDDLIKQAESQGADRNVKVIKKKK